MAWGSRAKSPGDLTLPFPANPLPLTAKQAPQAQPPAPPASPRSPHPRLWQLVELSGAHALLSPLEELVLLLAAVCHDLDHDGRTNAFHVSVHSELAQRYNDRAGGGAALGARLRGMGGGSCAGGGA